MSEVILIKEEDHGVIGVARTYQGVINFLVEDGWLVPLGAECGAWSWCISGYTLEEILQMDLKEFNRCFEDCFYLDVELLVD